MQVCKAHRHFYLGVFASEMACCLYVSGSPRAYFTFWISLLAVKALAALVPAYTLITIPNLVIPCSLMGCWCLTYFYCCGSFRPPDIFICFHPNALLLFEAFYFFDSPAAAPCEYCVTHQFLPHVISGRLFLPRSPLLGLLIRALNLHLCDDGQRYKFRTKYIFIF